MWVAALTVAEPILRMLRSLYRVTICLVSANSALTRSAGSYREIAHPALALRGAEQLRDGEKSRALRLGYAPVGLAGERRNRAELIAGLLGESKD